jgi:hypothetical protein
MAQHLHETRTEEIEVTQPLFIVQAYEDDGEHGSDWPAGWTPTKSFAELRAAEMTEASESYTRRLDALHEEFDNATRLAESQATAGVSDPAKFRELRMVYLRSAEFLERTAAFQKVRTALEDEGRAAVGDSAWHSSSPPITYGVIELLQLQAVTIDHSPEVAARRVDWVRGGVLAPDIYLKRKDEPNPERCIVVAPDPDRARDGWFVGYNGGQLGQWSRDEWEECPMPEYEKRFRGIT